MKFFGKVVCLLLMILTFMLYRTSYHDRNTRQNPFIVSYTYTRQNEEQSNSTCTKKINLVFLKVYKCASETTMRIFWRFVVNNNLNPLMKFYTPATIINNLSRPRLVPLPQGQTYNVFASHVNFTLNREEIRKRLPNNTVYIGNVRKPMSQFLSSLAFRNLYRRMEQYAKFDTTNISYADLLRMSIETNALIPGEFSNEQSEYFGIRNGAVQTGIDEVLKNFILIIIVEFYDESLVLLKRYLCWDLKDIIYNREHVTIYKPGQRRSAVDPVTQKWFQRAYENDIIFYQKCLEEFHRKVEAEGDTFHLEVEHFKFVLGQINDFCFSGKNGKIVIKESRWNNEFQFSLKDCKLLMNASNNYIRAWQMKKTGHWDNDPTVEYMKRRSNFSEETLSSMDV